jgi:MoaA/NifB/PqqE/SkfB family radical SAM enzyme
MSLDTFKQIMDRMPKTLCSIAFGVLSPIEQHPQVWEIFEECRERGVIPNVTINQRLTEATAEKLARYCGAVAVSVNPHNKEIAYETIHKLSNEWGMTQINIHIVLSNDSVDFIKSVVNDMNRDPRLAYMNALVMLSFKDKACTNAMTPISTLSYREVVDYCKSSHVNFGFDSCGANVFTEVCPELAQYAEPCESLLFSAYIDVNAKLYACSFTEKMGMWQEGIDVLAHDTFLEIWNSEKVQQWRDLLIGLNGRSCPEYNIGG